MCRPRSSALAARMTLYTAFFTMEMDRPAEMSSTLAPSFWACLTLEFMNTVHREPRFTGRGENSPSLEKSAML